MSRIVPFLRRIYSPYGYGTYFPAIIRSREDLFLDHFFDNNFNHIQLRDHVGKLTMGKEGGFTYQLDASGFHPNELKVSVEGEQIVVTGEHRESTDGESVERIFTRSVRIPTGIQKDSIQCSVDEQGQMCVVGTQQAVGQADQHTIPIDFKPSAPQAVEAGRPVEDANNGPKTDKGS